MKTLSVTAASAALFAAFAPSSAFADGRPCPYDHPYPVAELTYGVPDEVCGAKDMLAPMNLAFFDDYSWRAFIALVWPTREGKRGEADPGGKLEQPLPAGVMPGGPPLVFETFKAEWETFPRDPAAHPTGWTVPDYPADKTSMWRGLPPECAKQVMPGDFVLAPGTKLGDFANVHQAGLKNVPVLVAQNGTLVRYLAAFNEKAYGYILSRGLYIAKNLPRKNDPPLKFPAGSVTVKSSWIDLGKPGEKPTVANAETYHRRLAWLFDPFAKQDPKCERHVVGLVGLHIVQKTPDHLAWVWSSFEHVDTAPDRTDQNPLGTGSAPVTCQTPPIPTSRFSFHDKSGTPMGDVPKEYLADNWTEDWPPCTPPPVNIERLRPINHDPPELVTRSTMATNKAWQDELRKEENNSVWQFYRLILTQWSLHTRCPTDGCGDPSYTVPGNEPPNCSGPTCRLARSAIANVTMETWLQDDAIASRVEGKGAGCMACHNRVGNSNSTANLDFVWSLRINAYPATEAGTSAAVKSLNNLLELQLK
jgi:hypothetical protein